MPKSIFFKSKAVTVTAIAAFIILLTHFLFGEPEVLKLATNGGNPLAINSQDKAPCRNLPRVNDAVVVLRTGATEIQNKLPIHFNTTLRCYDDLIIFSDYAEEFQGIQVHDVLANVDQTLKDTNPDFDIYRRLQQKGRAGLRPDELSGDASFEGGKGGKKENAGWRLDKWKFLPMMQETLKLRPNKKWYIFLETDSYIIWSNMLQWLQKLDSSQALYYGSENQIGPDIYAHGGSAFVLSKPAILKAAQAYSAKQKEWNDWTAIQWAGDCVLGKVLAEAGVQLTWSWPMFQGGHPEKMDFTEGKPPEKKLWCAPALSYHHFSPTEMRRMWQFEQFWIQHREQEAANDNRKPWQSDEKDVLHHRDVFKKLVLPNITTQWQEWNNLSPDMIMSGNDNFDACFHMCEQSPECLQFSVGPPGCSISTRQVMLGQRWSEYRSYWVMDRIEKWMTNMDDCDGYPNWVVT